MTHFRASSKAFNLPLGASQTTRKDKKIQRSSVSSLTSSISSLSFSPSASPSKSFEASLTPDDLEAFLSDDDDFFDTDDDGFETCFSDDDLFDEADEECIRRGAIPLDLEVSSSQGKPKFGAYVVFHGRRRGVFRDWGPTAAATQGFSNNYYRGYRTMQDAQAAYAQAVATNTVGPPPSTSVPRKPVPPPCPIASEDAYWVIVRGPVPGVYHGRAAARKAMQGSTSGVVVERAHSLVEADRLFVLRYMAGRVLSLRSPYY